MLKSKQKQLREDLETLDMLPQTDIKPFKALDHIKPTQPVTDCIEAWEELHNIEKSIYSIKRINYKLPEHKRIKYNQTVSNLTVKQWNARQIFNRLHSKLKDEAKIEYALRVNEVNHK